MTRVMTTTPDLTSYSAIVVAFSGGKDSLACLLALLDLGVDRNTIELWHHDVDGREGKHKRLVDHWRPVHGWSEKQVWEIIERYSVNPHPAYRLGWGRVSCMSCIFGSPNQWASLGKLATARLERVAKYEEEFGTTIQRKKSVRHLAVLGQPYQWSDADAHAALSTVFNEFVIVAPGTWKLPAGAYGESCGPV